MGKDLKFSGKDITPDPFDQFSRWFEERPVPRHEETGASVLATSGPSGQPSARMVLVKEFGKEGFVFYTNYLSRKANQIAFNHSGALLFYWPDVHRQVRIEGRIEKIPESRSVDYFHKRQRESQLSAWASEQSAPVPGRAYLESRMGSFRTKYRDHDVPKPPDWGGYLLVPSWFEFWQEGADRLHDRISYTLEENGWKIERLAP